MLLRLALGSLLVAASVLDARAAPLFVPLGDLPGNGFWSEATRVSADGTTAIGVGSSASSSLVLNEAFRAGATLTPMGDLPGGAFSSRANGVSADGAIVVGRGVGLVDLGFALAERNLAFRWSAATGMLPIGMLPGGEQGIGSSANDVSADGSVIVGSSSSTIAAGYTEAFTWRPESGFVALGDLPGGPVSSAASAVSGDGRIVVGTGTVVTGSSFPQLANEAFRWTEATGLIGLGFLPFAETSSASDISSDGSTIVGWSGLGTSFAPFRWTEADGMSALPHLPSSIYGSQAFAASGDGSVIVGRSSGVSGDRAFVWDAANGTRDVRELLVGLGEDMTGWSLTSATGISDDGRIVVGAGRNPAGAIEAWYAIIPEPASGTLLALGVAALAAARRARA